MELTYLAPTKIVLADYSSGEQTGELIADLGCKKILCVHGRVVKKTGMLEPIIQSLVDNGIEVVEYEDVVPDPPIDVVERGAEFARASGVDGILAVGGGSAMDTAKAINILLGNGGSIVDYLGVDCVQKHGLPMIAIPTTSGTGSEVTSVSVISDPENCRKFFCAGKNIFFDLAILDPVLTYGLSASSTAATGMDALAHAVESMTSILSTPVTEPLAEQAIRLICKNLPIVCENGQDEDARSEMMLASTMAGMAFNNTFLHLGHSMAHVMGAHWHITHGVACALALPYAVEHVAKGCPEQIVKVGQAMGLTMSGDAEVDGKAVADAIRALSRRIGIPTLTEAGGKQEELNAAAADVMNEFMRNYSPVRVKQVDVTNILTALFAE